jgi:hypothetical protein
MKSAQDMSYEEMQTYLGRVDALKRSVGQAYRIFWPFSVFSPLSFTGLLLNFGVLFSWIFVLGWLATGMDSPEELLVTLGGLWAVVLCLSAFIGLVERHYRIKRRYRHMRRQQMGVQGPEDVMDHAREILGRMFRR